MDTSSTAREPPDGCEDRIDQIRCFFEIAVALDADQRERWLLENVSNSATRHVVKRLLEADGQPGFLDMSVMQLIEAICFPSAQASARRAP